MDIPNLLNDITTIRLDRFGSVTCMPHLGTRLHLPAGSVGYVRVQHPAKPGSAIQAVAVHNGPIVDGIPNGFFVEDLIAIARHRISTLNSQKASPENVLAMEHLQSAIDALDFRAARIAAEQEDSVKIEQQL